MKLVETLDVMNDEKVFMGPKVVKLEFDTETGRLSIDTPAMFTNPLVTLDDLKKVIDQFESVRRDDH